MLEIPPCFHETVLPECVSWITQQESCMRFLKRTGMVVLAAAALAVPSAASALSINGSNLHRLLISWTHQLQAHRSWFRQYRDYQHNTTKPPERSVPEPTAALLFGVGAALIAARTRKSS
jgi:PEP-CTERM motif